MFTAGQYRAKAAAYEELTSKAGSAQETKEFRKLERSFTTLADNEDWLAENYDRTLNAGGERPNVRPKRDEEHILRCLGAALIMHWDTIPAKLRRELFDSATAMGELPDTEDLRGKIARFLENAGTDEQPVSDKLDAEPARGGQEHDRQMQGERPSEQAVS